ncbi:DJ-1/PfpI family protein [Saccharibacillus sacchari]|uniref:DJ-1/PfpI family protein n=1 Tax=Saccharibacillus sacchari TaxID=456493 RepID=A0ACC6P6C0_9BACL
MKTYILVYEGFSQFEVILAAHLMKRAGEIVTVGLSTEPIVAHEGFRILPHTTIERVEAFSVDLFVIPGGDLSKITRRSELENLLKAVQSCGGKVGAISSGTLLLLDAGLASGRRFASSESIENSATERIDQPVVTDGDLVTAQSHGYVDFALELGRLNGIYKDETDYEQTLRFFKFFMPAEKSATADAASIQETSDPFRPSGAGKARR